MFGGVLLLRYKKVDLKKYFDVFRQKLINYTSKELKNAEDILMLIQYLMDIKSSFEANNEPKDLTPDEASSKSKKEILAQY